MSGVGPITTQIYKNAHKLRTTPKKRESPGAADTQRAIMELVGRGQAGVRKQPRKYDIRITKFKIRLNRLLPQD